MTLEELRERSASIAGRLDALAEEAAGDDFAPWIGAALVEAARIARLGDDVLKHFQWHGAWGS